jgi:hypothetical protein
MGMHFRPPKNFTWFLSYFFQRFGKQIETFEKYVGSQ